ncbi:MAG: methionyl-tRNA formyltransferase [Prevotella sp.]|nr:methionyl-tRNA formyltransferase [Prevotella sp.]
MKKEDIRIIFMGTPEFAVESLKALVENGYQVVAVVTQPDKPVGRHQDKLQPSAVKQYAVAHGIPVLQPVKMKDAEFIDQLQAFKADLQVVVAFRMLPEVVWAMPRLGTFNVHAALLPQYRGAAPINWAVINGETETGVTTFFLDKDIDTGRIILQKSFPIPDTADVEYVYEGLMCLGAKTAMETIDLIASRLPKNGAEETDFRKVLDDISVPQSQNVAELRSAPKIFKETCEINWNQPAKQIYDFIRGLSPYPGTWSNMSLMDNDAEKMDKTFIMKIFRTAKTTKPMTDRPGTFVIEKNRLYVNSADHLLEIIELQLSGKKRMDARSFLNGFHDVEQYRLMS